LENNGVIAGKDSLYASAVIDKENSVLIIKLVNSLSSSQQIELKIDGIKLTTKNARVEILAANDLYSYNRLSELDKLAPVEKNVEVKSNRIKEQLAPYSVSVFKIGYTGK
jgi:alpha-L-arabinofuranosidase